MKWLLALCLVTVTFAGCSESSAPPVEEQFSENVVIEATEDTGIIRGVVVDGTITPVDGASVTLCGYDVDAFITAEDGAFGFDQLDPGFYRICVEKLGFLPTETQTEVEAANSQPPVVKVILQPIPGFAPFHNLFQWDGFFQCAFGVQDPVVLGNIIGANLCFIINFYSGQDITQDDSAKLWFDEFVGVEKFPDWTQIETTWDSTQNLGDALRIRYQTAQPGTVGSIQCGYATVESPSPAVFTINRTEAERCGMGLPNPEGNAGGAANGLSYEFFAGYNGGPVGLALEQRFSSYVTAFYDYQPPADWRFHETSSVPGPN